MRQERAYRRSVQGPGHELQTYLIRVNAGDRGADVPPGYYVVVAIKAHGYTLRTMAGPLNHVQGLLTARKAAADHPGLHEKLLSFLAEAVTPKPQGETVH